MSQTVGTLLSRAYNAGSCLLGEYTTFHPLWPALTSMLGSIFGTGTNGAYVEKVENVIKLGDNSARKDGGLMIMNTEWGAFNNTVSPIST